MKLADRYREAVIAVLVQTPELNNVEVAKIAGIPQPHDWGRKVVAEIRRTAADSDVPDILDPAITPYTKDTLNVQKALLPNVREGEYKLYQPFILSPGRRVLVMNDIHIGFHILKHVEAAMRYGMEWGVDTVILNGDIADVDALKRHPGKKTFFINEVEWVRNFLSDLRKAFPQAKIVYAFGNHEHRFERYIDRNAWQLEGLFRLEDMLGLKEFGMDFVPVMSHVQLGELDIMHGHQISGSGENVALTLFKKAGGNIMFGDRHRSQSIIRRNFRGKTHGSWAVGCLCYLSPEYSIYNPYWANGFALVDSHSDGSFIVDNKVFVDGLIKSV